MVYVGDVANSIVLALNAEGLTQGTFNIGTARGVTLKDFAAVLKKTLPHRPHRTSAPASTSAKATKQSYCIFDITKAREQLGYEPQYDLERGIADYLESVRRPWAGCLR